MECLLKKDDVLAVLPTGCAFSRIATAGNSTLVFLELHYQRFSITDTDCGSVDFIFGTLPLGFGRNFLNFFAPGLLSREDTEDCSALFDTVDSLQVFTAMNFGLTTFIVL